MSNFIKYCVASAFMIGVGFCIYLISSTALTARESALVSVVLTILSVLAAWIVTHIYSQSEHKKAIEEVEKSHRANLKTYALKAAEKVNNLSTQLNRLAAYLEESLEESDNEKLREDLLQKRERIESAIHIINTLKSVNDTALSDWEGVIGEELDKQRERQEAEEAQLANLIERLETISESQIDTQQYAQDSTAALRNEVDSLRKDIRSMAVNIGVPSVKLAKIIERKPRRESVKSQCPACGQEVVYQQRANPESLKGLKCKTCEARLVSRYDEAKGFTLEIEQPVLEQVGCPSCHAICAIELGVFQGSTAKAECPSCHEVITISRASDGIRVLGRAASAQLKTLDEETIQLVKENLPPQPWPKGVGKSVAVKLGLPSKVVEEAILKLVRTGEFKVQFDGKVYEPVDAKKPPHSPEIE